MPPPQAHQSVPALLRASDKGWRASGRHAPSTLGGFPSGTGYVPPTAAAMPDEGGLEDVRRWVGRAGPGGCRCLGAEAEGAWRGCLTRALPPT